MMSQQFSSKALTIKYYNDYAIKFCRDTENLDISPIQNKFLGFLSKGDYVLDFGCGVGRDAKYFLDHGIRVDMVDASKSMCAIAKRKTGKEPLCVMFQKFSALNKYNGIWACASLLHLSSKDLIGVLMNLSRSLKKDGLFYLSFKYGYFEGIRDGRFFLDMTEERLREIIRGVDSLAVQEIFITSDVRPHKKQQWVNAFLRKKSTEGNNGGEEMGKV